MAGSVEDKHSNTASIVDLSPHFEEPGNLIAEDYLCLNNDFLTYVNGNVWSKLHRNWTESLNLS